MTSSSKNTCVDRTLYEELLELKAQKKTVDAQIKEITSTLIEQLKSKGIVQASNGDTVSIKRVAKYTIKDTEIFNRDIDRISNVIGFTPNLIRAKYEPNMIEINKMPEWVKDILFENIKTEYTESLSIKKASE